MLVGATNSGKTVVFEILKHAMSTIKKMYIILSILILIGIQR